MSNLERVRSVDARVRHKLIWGKWRDLCRALIFDLGKQRENVEKMMKSLEKVEGKTYDYKVCSWREYGAPAMRSGAIGAMGRFLDRGRRWKHRRLAAMCNQSGPAADGQVPQYSKFGF